MSTAERNMRASEIAPGIYVNAGSGPVGDDSTREQADTAIARLLDDLEITSISAEFIEMQKDGRYTYLVSNGDVSAEVDMPGLPIDRLRYVKAPGQNIWAFPRLYVEGSSWVWMYAVNILREIFGEQS